MAGGGIGEAVAWARERLARGPALLATSRPPADVAALQARFGPAAVSERLEAALAQIAAALAGDLSRLIVAGGETSGAVVDRLGLQVFAPGAEIAPGGAVAGGRRRAACRAEPRAEVGQLRRH